MSSQFVWYDLSAPDVEQAKAFYSGLLGWTVQEVKGEWGVYTMWHVGGKGIGGIMPVGPDQQIPPHWLSYLHAPGTIEEMVSTAESKGANVMQPVMPIPGIGKMAVIADPQGAVFAPFETLPMEGADDGSMFVPPGTPGAPTWNELITTDVEGAKSFYTAIGGFTTSEMPGLNGTYTLLNGDKGPAAGMMPKPEQAPQPAWLTYFEITQESVDEALERVKTLGGQVGMGPMEVPGIATIAVVSDAAGAWFGLMKSVPQT